MSRYLLEPLSTSFGAQIFGIDLSRPLNESDSTCLVEDLLKYRVLVVRDQVLSHEDHIRVSRLFGEPEVHVQDQYTVPGFAQIVTISNIHRNGAPIGLYDGDNEQEWHTDLSFRPQMSSVSLLYSVVAPRVGGQARFADTTAAYDDLPDELAAQVDGREAVHSLVHLFEQQAAGNPAKVPLTEVQRARVPDVVHPLVRVHPQTGRRSLLLGDMIIRSIVGLDQAESAVLLDRLHAHATGERYVYSHRWAVGDLVIWDNRATMHTASPCDHTRHQRLLYRTTVM